VGRDEANASASFADVSNAARIGSMPGSAFEILFLPADFLRSIRAGL